MMKYKYLLLLTFTIAIAITTQEVIASNIYVTAESYNQGRIYNFSGSLYGASGYNYTLTSNSSLQNFSYNGSTSSASYVSVMTSNHNNAILSSNTYYTNNSICYHGVGSSGALVSASFTGLDINMPVTQTQLQAKIDTVNNICNYRLNVTYVNGSSILSNEYNISTNPNVPVRAANNFTISSYLPGHLNFTGLNETNYTFWTNSSGYALVNYTINITSNYTATNLTYYTSNSIAFSFYDEQLNTLINTTTVTGYVTSSVYSTSFTTTNGTKYVDLLYPFNYTITASATDYTTRTYIIEITNNSNTALGVYLLNDTASTIIKVVITNTNARRVGDADVYLQKKNLTGTNYYTVQSCTTNNIGECLLNVDLYDTTYRILVYYDGVLKFNSRDTQISSTEVAIQINIGDITITRYFDINSINYNISYSNSTKSFTFFYHDPSSIVTSGCLEVQRRIDTSVSSYVSNCSSSTSDTLSAIINTSLDDEFIATGYVVLTDNKTIILTSLSIVTSEFKQQFGRVGFFYFGFLVLGVMIFAMMRVHPIAAIIVAGIGTIIFNSLGFISVGTTAVMSLVILIILIIVMMKNT